MLVNDFVLVKKILHLLVRFFFFIVDDGQGNGLRLWRRSALFGFFGMIR